LFQPANGQRARLDGVSDGERSYPVGTIHITGDNVSFQETERPPAQAGDPAVFAKADNGWAEGLHQLDRFVKNTYEILSPLNALTAQLPMTHHQFLSADRTVQQTVFGEGRPAVRVIVNASARAFDCDSDLGGKVRLPPDGFSVDGPTFVGFYALSWGG